VQPPKYFSPLRLFRLHFQDLLFWFGPSVLSCHYMR
jgi:hypothetical protein